MPERTAAIVSVGSSVPESVMTNDDLARLVDTSDEWIATRTGIRRRHITPRDNPVTAWELGARASRVALERAQVRPEDVDMVVCATFTPDYFFPSTACKIQHALGCTGACAFDVSAACAGFVYGLSIADSFIRSGRSQTVLIVGSEVISRTLDWTDRGTCILFGDAAGAVVVQASDREEKGIAAVALSSNGAMADILYLPAWGEERYMRMRGNEVFKHAVRLMSDVVLDVCSQARVGVGQVDLLIPHQANMRIIQGLAGRLGVPMEKVVTNIEEYGNTSSASIPLALDEAWQKGRVGDGTLVAMTALGGGVTVGGALVRF
jgi:3-oxoacyl-[acyl-carrier-protein] synthase-3